MLTSYMDVNFNKYSNVSFLAVLCIVFVSSKSHIQVLNRSSKAGAALVKTIASIEEDWRRENVGIYGRLYSRKKSRFDRLHARKVSTFFPQTLMGGQQRDTRARTCWIGVFVTSFGLGSDLECKRPGKASAFAGLHYYISARSNKFASKWSRL